MHTAIYFYYLLLLSSISFGSHFAKSSLSVFGLYMINDHTITPAGLGLLLSACSLPSMFIPLLVGHSVDKTKREIIITLVLFLFEIAGLTIFCSAVFSESFTLAVIALLIYGVGSSSISVIQRILVTLFLRENISFTTGFYVALANVAKMMGKVLVGPAVVAMGSYKEALILPIMGCVLSLLCYLLFHSSNDHGTIYINFIASSGRRRCNTEVEFHIHKGSIECTIPEPAEGSEVDPSETSPMMYPRRASVDYGSVSQDPMQMYEERLSIECEEPRTPLSDEARSPRSSPATTLPIAFYWMAGIHTLYILTFHALNNFLPHLLYSSYGSTAMEAGYISSIPFLVIIVLAPGMGFIVDRVGQRMLFCTATALMAVIAYTVLIYTDANPYLKMALISIPHGMIPVLTLAEISSLLPIASVGIAFGIVEVLDSVVNVLGNILFGWLYNVTGSYQTGMIVLLVFAWTGFVALVYMTIKEIVPQSRESIDRRVYDTDLVGM